MSGKPSSAPIPKFATLAAVGIFLLSVFRVPSVVG
jgi:hypothetical protein